MEIVGILLERHSDHIILSNGTKIFLREGVSANHVPLGRSLTATCRIHVATHVNLHDAVLSKATLRTELNTHSALFGISARW